MFLPAQKIPEGWKREEQGGEGISEGAAELNIYWEIRAGLGYKTIYCDRRLINITKKCILAFGYII